MTRIQRLLIGVTAAGVAARLILPVIHATRSGDKVDFSATVFQVLAIVAVGAALFILTPTLRLRGATLAAPAALVIVGLAAVFVWWYENLKTESLRYRVEEGRRFGFIVLGMSPQDVRRTIGTPVDEARTGPRGEVTEFWETNQGSWNVTFDGATKKATSIGFYRPSDKDEDLKNCIARAEVRQRRHKLGEGSTLPGLAERR
jgi:hypothetical protein